MTQVRRTGSGDVQAIKSDGTIIVPDENGYVTLGVATYYFILGGSADSTIVSAGILTDAAIAGVFTLEVCNFPRYKTGEGSGTDDITDIDTSSAWVKYDPSSAYVPTVGTGWTVANATLTKTAGLGGAFYDLVATGAKRIRIKAVISTGGKVRINQHGKY